MSNYMIISPRTSIAPSTTGGFVVLVDGIQVDPNTDGWDTAEEAERAWHRENPDAPNLNDMARDMVGDGKTPNLYFVTVDGKTRAAFNDKERAVTYAQQSFGAPSAQEYPIIIEDRLNGVVWENGAAESEQEAAEDEEANTCPKTKGKHVLDSRADYVDNGTSSNKGIIIDVWCKACGRSGSIAVEPEEVNW